MAPTSDLLFPPHLDDTTAPQSAGTQAPQSLRPTSTKIVATLGPASQSTDTLKQLIQAGATVFRLNFSHGDHETHSKVLANIRKAADELKMPVAVLLDLCGPKIRISHVPHDQPVQLTEGQAIRLTTTEHWEKAGENAFDIATNYQPILTDVSVGESILINDGKVRLLVVAKHADHLETTVQQPGEILCGKGINLPQAKLSTPSVTEKDWEDLSWGIANQVDFVALSFVREAQDLIQVRDQLDRAGCVTQLIAKIERPEALANMEDILDWADGIMIARGDLALETNYAAVPMVQKRLIEACRQQNKPVITATQMLDSMVDSATPTRAEVSDIANAIMDGSDAVMLSNESAVGKFPVQAVRTMVEVSEATEPEACREFTDHQCGGTSRMAAMAHAARTVADRCDAAAIVVYTQSGFAARHLSSLRMDRPVVACTNLAITQRQLSLSYGVNSILLPQLLNREQFVQEITRTGTANGWWHTGDSLVFLSSESGCSGDINCIQAVQVD